MEIKVTKGATGAIAKVQGRVDTLTAPEFEKAILSVLEEAPAELLLDCSGLEYISSAGLRALLLGVKAAKAKGVNFVLANVNAFVNEVLTLSGFNTLFEIR